MGAQVDPAVVTHGHAATASPPAGVHVAIDAGLVARLDQPGPCYTVYPGPDSFTTRYAGAAYATAIGQRRQLDTWQSASALQLHIPFGDALSYYNKYRHALALLRGKELRYLAYLEQEIGMQGRLFDGMNLVDRLRFGGGSPTSLDDAQLERLWLCLRRHFRLAPDGEGDYLVDVDARSIDPARLHRLRHLGFNRIDIALQGIDGGCQGEVLRLQPERQVLAVVAAARAARFHSVGMALLYGLPMQDLRAMGATLDLILAADPERVSLHNYAQLAAPSALAEDGATAALPPAGLKGELLAQAVERLIAHGYVSLGMNQFAKPTDPLVLAQRHGTLHWGVDGLSCHAAQDWIACGVAAIGAVGASYFQNHLTLDAYCDALDNDQLPIARGTLLGSDDQLRRDLIGRLMCDYGLSISAFEHWWSILFSHYFAEELARLLPLQSEGLVRLDGDRISITHKGRLAMRNICMVFDRHLHAAAGGASLAH